MHQISVLSRLYSVRSTHCSYGTIQHKPVMQAPVHLSHLSLSLRLWTTRKLLRISLSGRIVNWTTIYHIPLQRAPDEGGRLCGLTPSPSLQRRISIAQTCFEHKLK